jgi:hypothetical protein
MLLQAVGRARRIRMLGECVVARSFEEEDDVLCVGVDNMK